MNKMNPRHYKVLFISKYKSHCFWYKTTKTVRFKYSCFLLSLLLVTVDMTAENSSGSLWLYQLW